MVGEMGNDYMKHRSKEEIIAECARILEERGKIYGDATQHYEGQAALFSAYFSREIVARDAAILNVLAKIDRIRRADPDSETFRDSVIDAINYLAIAWEVS